MALRLLYLATVKYLIAGALALSSAACGQNGIVESVLPSPTALIQAANTVCNTQITGLELDVDSSGPYLIVDVTFASTPSPVDIEIERYLSDGRTEPVAQLSNVVGRTRVALNFNTKYRGRARAGTCTWSPWVDRQIGPPNRCEECAVPPPPPPPPPPPRDPPPPPKPEEPPPPDDECRESGEGLAWQPLGSRLKVTRMVEEPPPPPQECGPR